MNGYTLGCLQEQAKWLTGTPIRQPLEFCIFGKRLFYEKKKKHVLNQTIAALRRSVGLPGRFVTVWKNRTRQTHTHTHNYCDPVAHVRQGLTTTNWRMCISVYIPAYRYVCMFRMRHWHTWYRCVETGVVYVWTFVCTLPL